MLYDKSTVTYICFQKHEEGIEPEWIAQTEHDEQGRIIRYTLGLFIGFECDEIEQEIYSYGDEGMEKVIMWNYLSANCITQQIYRLHHDSDGYLTGVENLDYEGYIFEITPSKRRKV